MLPYDVVGRYLLPRLRCLVANRLLRHYGLSQLKVSKLLGVSQAMVSKYSSEDPDRVIKEMSSMGLDPEEVSYVVFTVSEALSRGDVVGYERTLIAYINSLLSRGVLCHLHRSSYPPIGRCEVCRELFKPQPDFHVADVVEAFDLFRNTATSYVLVPEVGTNIVSCRRGARDVADVVGFSGRIVRIGRGVSASGEPIYGGSRHLAAVLLAVHSRWEEIRGAIAISFIESCLRFYRDRGFAVHEVGPHESKERIVSDIEDHLRSLPGDAGPPDLIADLGGRGIEPVVYVLGRTAVDAVRKALLCARLLEG